MENEQDLKVGDYVILNPSSELYYQSSQLVIGKIESLNDNTPSMRDFLYNVSSIKCNFNIPYRKNDLIKLPESLAIILSI